MFQIKKIEKLIINGNFITMNEDNPKVSYLGITGGKIVKAGDQEKLPELIRNCDRVVDLEGRTVLPGLTDAHMHLISYSNKKSNQVDLNEVNSMDELINTVKEFINKKNIKPGEWVIGSGWNHERYADSELPTRAHLDKASTINPIMLFRTCYHIVAVNSKALEVAKIDENTTYSDDGKIDKDIHGVPTGIIRENAIELIDDAIPMFEDKETIKKLIVSGCNDLAEYGITTVHTDDFSYISNKKVLLEAYKELEYENKLPIRVVLQLRVHSKQDLYEYIDMGIKSYEGSDMLKYGPVKLIADGSLGSGTAALNEPYSDEQNNRGIFTFDENVFEEIIFEAFKSDFDIAIHAIGDRTMEIALTAFEKHKDLYKSKDFRPSIIHCQIANKDIIHRFSTNDIIANIQPIFINYDWSIAEKRVGKKRLEYSYCWNKFTKNGITCVASSDAPIDTFNPMYGIYCAVTRKDLKGMPDKGWLEHEKLNVYEAIKLYTINSSVLSKDEEEKGCLKEGMYADFIVLSDNIEKITEDSIRDIKVIETYINGEKLGKTLNNI